MRCGGVSTVEATIVLVAIAIVGGFLIYNIYTSIFSAQTLGGVIIVEAKLVKYLESGGKAVFVIVIKNSGSIAIVGLEVKLAGKTLPSSNLSPNPTSDSPLEPGESTSGVWKDLTEYVAGNRYTVVVVASLQGGGTTSAVTSVKCVRG